MSDQERTQANSDGAPCLVLAADLGGTHFRVALIDSTGAMLARHQIDTCAWEGPTRVIKRMADACRLLLDRVPGTATLMGVGVAAPSPIDPKRGVVYQAPNLHGWFDVPLRDELQSRLGLKTLVGNDANLAALGEWRFGAGKGFDDIIFLTFSTGVGSGFIVAGRLVIGHSGLSGEAGHMTLKPDGPRCACGRLGCLEALSSGTGILAEAVRRLPDCPDSALNSYQPLAAEHVDAEAARGDPLALAVMQESGYWAGAGIANLIMIFDPGVVVLGGGVSRSGEHWWSAVRQSAHENVLRAYRPTLKIVAAALGDDVGLFGAAAAVFDPEIARSMTPETDVVSSLVALVDARLRAAVRITASPFTPLGAMQAYHLGWYGLDLLPLDRPLPSGKRLRPVLCLLACRALGGPVDASLGVAAAIELIHNFSLVHDDIQDRSRTRRGRPTVWSRWSSAQAINVGDALYASANLAAAADDGLPSDRRLEALRVLTEACLLLVEGQYLDLALQDRAAASLEEYEAMVERKTAALLAASLEAGAVCAGASDAARATYYDLGNALGIAFQYQDDLLGVWGDPRVTGKSAAADLRSGKKALPAVLAFGRASGGDAETLVRLYALPRRDKRAVAEIREIFERLGVRDAAEKAVEARYRQARALLADVPADLESRALLVGLVDSLATRST